MRMLLVTKKSSRKLVGGRELLSVLHRDCLREIFAENLSIVELGSGKLAGAWDILSGLFGFIDGLTRASISDICAKIGHEDIDHVYLDGSNLGLLADRIKRKYPTVKIYTFLHNVEARFFLGSFVRTKSVRALAITWANYIAERKAVGSSDFLICLSSRDSDVLNTWYGKHATDILPMALHDTNGEESRNWSLCQEKFLLFVGGAFYANVAGIEWFAEHVAPNVVPKTYVVGRGLDSYRDLLESSGNVKVIGGVENLSHWYQNAHLVVAPIFDGSGMKTKVAEALMYGKKIVGTQEAFSGYENTARDAGWVCSSAAEFIGVINEEHALSMPKFDPELRGIFEKYYSYGAALERFRSIFSNVN